MSASYDRTIGERLKDLRRNRLALTLAGVAIIALIAFTLVRDKSESRNQSETSPTVSVDSIVRLDSAGVRLAGVELITVSRGGAGELVANGTITYDANRVSVVSPHVDGRIVSVRADLGQNVGRGTVLAIVESPEIGQMRGDLERASANAQIALRNYEREKRLYEQQITPQKEMLEAEAAYRTAEADRRSAIARLGSIGAASSGSGRGGSFGLIAPVGGTVVERNASPGQSVGSTVNLFTVADLRNVWITVDVYEGDLARVRQGVQALVTPTAFPDERFTGRVTYAGGVVDPESRTFKVRVEVPNPASRLRPGMFAQVRIPTAMVGADAAQIIIPEEAVQNLNGNTVVFVALGSGQYVARKVTIAGHPLDGRVTIASGLREGEQIAVSGAFQLKSEMTKGSGGGGD